MKQRILLLFVLATAFGSCSVYKNGQTPDDVYYSPVREPEVYVNTEDDSRRDEASPDDRYLRMKAINRNRWSQFDEDVAYWNNPTWNNQVYYNSFRNPYYSPYYSPWVGTGWNVGLGFSTGWGYGNVWNPFCPGYYGTPIVIVNPKPINTRQYTPRGTNLNSYSSRGATYVTNPKTGERIYSVGSGATTTSSSSSFRTYRSSGGSYYNPSSSGSLRTSSGSPSRSFDNSPSMRSDGGSRSSGSSSGGSRSSGGSSGGSAPVRSFPRGGGK